ncbi:DNA mismatch repair protein MutT [Thermosipho ferrireducens]|uniref:DNA mismatch repair protein MutT n=1 Tax=Thermosipho ferrireducens TaxID=2571116 RepID=A0ABX7S8M5_9BACT|nr:DNA mismatch repair protein MutT [Thermosipho ferrireducens]QTA38181.1 DNA mismatch repair protein MutT [Thermosipho ferrireducens]
MAYENEKVLVVPTDDVIKLCNGKIGLVEVEEVEILKLIKEAGFFIDREKAEFDETIRQVIPYILLKENNKYLLFKRTSAQGEKRLHGKITIGVGGHINTDDSLNPIDAFKKGMQREIAEEVNVKVLNMNYIGVINITDNAVSRVHVGVCYEAEIEYYGLVEKDKFIEIFSEAPEIYNKEMEGWSKAVVKHLGHMQK